MRCEIEWQHNKELARLLVRWLERKCARPRTYARTFVYEFSKKCFKHSLNHARDKKLNSMIASNDDEER